MSKTLQSIDEARPTSADDTLGNPPPERVERRRSRRSPDRWAAVAFLLPGLSLFSLFALVPIFVGVALSFYEWDLIRSPEFVGLENYRTLWGDDQAIDSLVVTIKLIVGGLVPTVVIGLISATLLNARFRGIAIIRTMYYIPIVISLVASGVLWRLIFQPNRGLLNWVLELVGIDGPAWLSSTTWALPSVTIVLIWSAIPLSTMLYLAGLQAIPTSVLEAAKLDGAGPVATLWYVIWPMVKSTTILVSLITLIAMAFGSFDLVASLTQGGPLKSTNTLIYYMYDTAFNKLQVGYASALAVFNFAAVFSIAGVLLLLSRRVAR